jgi:hypothetical protein
MRSSRRRSSKRRRSSSRGRKSSLKCRQKHTQKYTSRPSPPFPANQCCGMRKLGNDGKMWDSTKNSNGVCTWKHV